MIVWKNIHPCIVRSMWKCESHFLKSFSWKSRCFKSTKLDEFSLRCSLADLKNDSFREQPSQQIIVKYFRNFSTLFCLLPGEFTLWFPLCLETIFWRKKGKKIIEDKRLQSLFLWVKRKKVDNPACLPTNLPSQILAQVT